MKQFMQIHQEALAVAKRYKACEIELIEILQLIGEQRIFYHLQYNSLFQYAVQALGLSEEVAYIYISYTTENAGEHAKVLNLREVYVELKLGLPEKLMLKLRQAQDLVSQSRQKHVSLVETLEAMVDVFIERKDPLAKAKRQKMRGKIDADVKKPVPGPVNVDAASSARKPFSAVIKNQLYLKYQRQCSYLDESGNRCTQRRLLEIHHIVPVAQGGTNDLENLTLLCQGHHRASHISELEISSSF